MEKFVFIDESGNENLELALPSISSFYVVCALVVDAADMQLVGKRFADVQQKYFLKREMKSEGMTNEPRRQQILQELTGVPFSLHVLIGNKSLITSPGLQYPKPFIKWLHRYLYQSILKDYSTNVHVVADCIKNPAFMQEMKNYLDNKGVLGLFDIASFDFEDSKTNHFIQAADFIAGSIRACFERNPQTPTRDPSWEKLEGRVVHVLPYPDSYHRYIRKLPGPGEHDGAIEKRAVQEAEEFLHTCNENSNAEKMIQGAIVRRLLTELMFNDDQWVSTATLIEEANILAPEPLTEQAFRGVIGRLRDFGLLIASRSQGGYKLPTSIQDVTEFVNRQNSQIAPMVDRLRMARDVVLRATDGAVDILGADEFKNLKLAISALPYWHDPTIAELQSQPRPRARQAENVPLS